MEVGVRISSNSFMIILYIKNAAKQNNQAPDASPYDNTQAKKSALTYIQHIVIYTT